MRYLVLGLIAGFLFSPMACAAGSVAGNVSEADARLALRIASGLAESAPADVEKADVASSMAEGFGPKVTILDAVLLLRGAWGHAPAGVNGSALLQLRDDVRLQGATVRNYTLARAYRFSGRLVDAEGNPASGAVWLEDDQGVQKGFAQFGREGEFRMAVDAESLHPRVMGHFTATDGHGAIFLTAPLPRSADVALSADARRDIVQPERPQTGFVAGTITSDGVEVTDVGASVDMGGEVRGGSRSWPKDGRYLMECPAGTALLTLDGRVPGHPDVTVEYRSQREVEVIAGHTVTMDIAFPRLVMLTGTIQGGPDWRILQVTLDSGRDDGDWLRAGIRDVDREGFSMPVAPGRYMADVLFERREGASYWQYGYSMDVTVPEGGGHVDLVVPEETPDRTLSGRVVDSAGRPVAGAQVRLFRWREKDERFAYVETDTDANGRYRITAPNAGYSVYVEPPHETR